MIDAIVAVLATILAQLGGLAALQGRRRPRSQHMSLDPLSLTLQKVVRVGAANQRGLL